MEPLDPLASFLVGRYRPTADNSMKLGGRIDIELTEGSCSSDPVGRGQPMDWRQLDSPNDRRLAFPNLVVGCRHRAVHFDSDSASEQLERLESTGGRWAAADRRMETRFLLSGPLAVRCDEMAGG